MSWRWLWGKNIDVDEEVLANDLVRHFQRLVETQSIDLNKAKSKDVISLAAQTSDVILSNVRAWKGAVPSETLVTLTERETFMVTDDYDLDPEFLYRDSLINTTAFLFLNKYVEDQAIKPYENVAEDFMRGGRGGPNGDGRAQTTKRPDSLDPEEEYAKQGYGTRVWNFMGQTTAKYVSADLAKKLGISESQKEWLQTITTNTHHFMIINAALPGGGGMNLAVRFMGYGGVQEFGRQLWEGGVGRLFYRYVGMFVGNKLIGYGVDNTNVEDYIFDRENQPYALSTTTQVMRNLGSAVIRTNNLMGLMLAQNKVLKAIAAINFANSIINDPLYYYEEDPQKWFGNKQVLTERLTRFAFDVYDTRDVTGYIASKAKDTMWSTLKLPQVLARIARQASMKRLPPPEDDDVDPGGGGGGGDDDDDGRPPDQLSQLMQREAIDEKEFEEMDIDSDVEDELGEFTRPADLEDAVEQRFWDDEEGKVIVSYDLDRIKGMIEQISVQSGMSWQQASRTREVTQAITDLNTEITAGLPLDERNVVSRELMKDVRSLRRTRPGATQTFTNNIVFFTNIDRVSQEISDTKEELSMIDTEVNMLEARLASGSARPDSPTVQSEALSLLEQSREALSDLGQLESLLPDAASASLTTDPRDSPVSSSSGQQFPPIPNVSPILTDNVVDKVEQKQVYEPMMEPPTEERLQLLLDITGGRTMSEYQRLRASNKMFYLTGEEDDGGSKTITRSAPQKALVLFNQQRGNVDADLNVINPQPVIVLTEELKTGRSELYENPVTGIFEERPIPAPPANRPESMDVGLQDPEEQVPQGDSYVNIVFQKMAQAYENFYMWNAASSEITETKSPTTEAPTTQAPTTQAPTTQAPTTQAPTTQAPTTQAPTTQVPTTQAPTTQAPTTQVPTTQAPTTQVPTTQAPTTQAPTTQAPTTQAPTTQAPTTQAPTTQAPTTQAPTTQPPTTQAPTDIPTQAPFVLTLDPIFKKPAINDDMEESKTAKIDRRTTLAPYLPEHAGTSVFDEQSTEQACVLKASNLMMGQLGDSNVLGNVSTNPMQFGLMVERGLRFNEDTNLFPTYYQGGSLTEGDLQSGTVRETRSTPIPSIRDSVVWQNATIFQ
jgi:hypothetical protein